MEDDHDLLGKFNQNLFEIILNFNFLKMYLFLGKLDEAFDDENFESHKYSYVSMREFLIIILRILASKFNTLSFDQQDLLIKSIFLDILESVPDYDLKVEIINILKCLFVEGHTPLDHHKLIEFSGLSK